MRVGTSLVVGSSVSPANMATWFGTGDDGDVTISTDTPIEVGLDGGQIIKQYNNLTIAQGGMLRPANRCCGMILLVKGDLTVDGTISADKCCPLRSPNEELLAQERHIAVCGALTGGRGGDGSRGEYASHSGGQGGDPCAFGGGYGGGGAGTSGNGGKGDRPSIGSPIPYPGTADADGTYGAGGGAEGTSDVGGGGPGGSGAISIVYYYQTDLHKRGTNGDAVGGGGIWIFVQGKVRINATGKISAVGGNGAAGVYGTEGHYHYDTWSGAGGGGGGGIVAIVHTGDYINNGSVVVSGGSGGAKASGSNESIAGSAGSVGTVFVSTLDELLA